MGPLIQRYVALAALSFKFVTACQDGIKLSVLFYFILLLIFNLSFIAFFCVLT